MNEHRTLSGLNAAQAHSPGLLRLEAVTQKQLRSGTSNLDASQVTGEDAFERHTRNLNRSRTAAWRSAG